VVVFPNCKINLGLNVIRKRNDGYHDIETVFYPVPLQDALEAVQNDEWEEKNIQSSIPIAIGINIQISTSGLTLQGKNEDNICIKAYQLLKKDFSELPSIKLHLHKAIPAGAGLGGGSADGAFTLKLLNQKFNLGLSKEKLIDYSLELGSDCPFFIINTPCLATGRGEILEAIKPDLSAYKFILVNPGIHISTSEAFLLATPTLHSKSIGQIVYQSIESWKEDLKNDFEEPVFKKHPEINLIKDELYKAGALYASMTGSGSTVYGIFEKDRNVNFVFPENYFVKQLICKL
jgi:4-diphosphocytidyl-2-C-methyl-D-erythritol kinase